MGIIRGRKWNRRLGMNLHSNTRGRLWRAVIAEYVATTAFVFCACASCVVQNVDGNYPTLSQNLVAGLTQGLAIGSLVYAIAFTSGGHINPAVTLALTVSGDIPILHALAYMIAQLTGGISGAALLSGVMPARFEGNLGTTQLSNGIGHFQGVVFEAIVTFILVFVIFGTVADVDDEADTVKPLAPIPIGFSVAVCVTIAFAFTGGSLNPARSFGPAAISNTWKNQWIYWVGPLLGAFLASLFHVIILRTKPKEHPAKGEHTEADYHPKTQEEKNEKDVEKGEINLDTSARNNASAAPSPAAAPATL